MNILILGYYDRSNLGDEMYKEVMGQVLIQSGNIPKLTFICTDDLSHDTDLSSYDAIICGGGDIVNEYFFDKIKDSSVVTYTKNIFAVSIGIPIFEFINNGSLNIFDHIFIRSKHDILKIQQKYGSTYVHYHPDLGFLKYNKVETNKIFTNKIGVFLIQPIAKFKSIVDGLIQFLTFLSKDYEIVLYRFDSSDNLDNDDNFINSYIAKTINSPNVSFDCNIYNVDQMLDIFRSLNLTICMRYHAHIFATITSCPFLSIATTRKVKLYLEDCNYQYFYNVNVDSNETLNNYELIKIFNNVIDNSTNIKHHLKQISETNYNLIKSDQIINLIKVPNKRMNVKNNNFQYSIGNEDSLVEQIYHNLTNDLLSYNIDLSREKQVVTPEIGSKIAEKMCYLITGLSSSKYLYGSKQNIVSNPYNLHEMIKWIVQDYNLNYQKYRNRINLNYINQSGFNGLHRSGWQFVIEYLQMLHCDNGVICDTYLDQTFNWGQEVLVSNGILPYTSPWIGFIHHTPNTEYTSYNTIRLFENPCFLQSLIMCQGLYCLSSYLTNWVKDRLKTLELKIEVNTLYHPTMFLSNNFTFNKYLKNNDKKLINVGAWYRNPFTIFTLKVPLTKIALNGKDMNNYFKPNYMKLTYDNILNNDSSNKWEYYLKEYLKSNDFLITKFNLDPLQINLINLNIIYQDDQYFYDEKDTYQLNLVTWLVKIDKEVGIITYLSDSDYDQLLNSNVIFLDLIDCSAVNTLIECMVRNTPLIINYSDTAAEYLGTKYPLFYYKDQDFEEQINKLLLHDNIKKGYKYLKRMNKDFLRIEEFIRQFKSSSIYNKLLM